MNAWERWDCSAKSAVKAGTGPVKSPRHGGAPSWLHTAPMATAPRDSSACPGTTPPRPRYVLRARFGRCRDQIIAPDFDGG